MISEADSVRNDEAYRLYKNIGEMSIEEVQAMYIKEGKTFISFICLKVLHREMGSTSFNKFVYENEKNI